jgi:hypothetical protein
MPKTTIDFKAIVRVRVQAVHRSFVEAAKQKSGGARTFLSAAGCAHVRAERNVRAATRMRCASRTGYGLCCPANGSKSGSQRALRRQVSPWESATPLHLGGLFVILV